MNDISVLILTSLGGIVTMGTVLLIIFKRSISFLVGILVLLSSLGTLILADIDFSESVLVDKIIGIISLGIVMSLLLYMFDRRVGRHLRSLTKKIDQLSHGDLSVEFDKSLLTRKNELGDIVDSMNRMLTSLKESVGYAKGVSEGQLYIEIAKNKKGNLDEAIRMMIDNLRRIAIEIKSAALQVDQGSGQVSASAQTISSGSSEQAASSEELASSMEEMSTNIQQNTEHAMEAERVAQIVSKDIESVSASFTESAKAMQQIKDKITSINDIAERTDLLAINAAIEAARAGEYGKGFAVVASEIRELAENSQRTAELISDVASRSLDQFNDSEKKLFNIIPEITKTATLVKEIAAASGEQNTGVLEINEALQQFSSVTQNNSALSEEMAASSEQLSSQSDSLNEAISFLKTTREEHHTAKKADLRKEFERLKKLLDDDKAEEIPNFENEKIQPQKTITQNTITGSGVDINMEDDDFEEYKK
ncbi:MAG: methyl-accepting chemotaxis protein [Salinivirgaceae bacterium]|jgi:methyl-accepting chemotaxis protein|nr:methyl-accepting chemotaxis protein [Salinivirgaceae bacterium]